MPTRHSQATRRATNVTLSAELLDQAPALGLNVSQSCEEGLRAKIVGRRAAQWLEENRAALASSNDYVERNCLSRAEFASSDGPLRRSGNAWSKRSRVGARYAGFIAAVPVRELRTPVLSLDAHGDDIMRALDMLLNGF